MKSQLDVFTGKGLNDYLEQQKDVVELAEELYAKANGDSIMIQNALQTVCTLLSTEKNLFAREDKLKKICKIYGQKKSTIEKVITSIKKENSFEVPEGESFQIKHSGIDPTEAYMKGFYEYMSEFGKKDFLDTGYWFRQDGGFVQVTNFIVKPLYHIYSDVVDENRRMMLVNNGMHTRVVELQSKQMMSVDGFCGVLYGKGNFLPKAGFGKPQLLKILNDIGENFPMIYEMKKLGWQSEGVFAFFNKTFTPPKQIGEIGKLNEYDEYGVTKEKFGDKHLFSPAIGKGQELTRATDDIYENDRYLEWKKSPLSYTEWVELFHTVYGDRGWFGIAWSYACLFRDLILQHNKIPILYFYGPTGSGKSEICESILNLFYSGKDAKGDLYKPFNLNQGTEFAFFNALETNTNTPFVGNEFDENTLADERFMAFKSSYDGEGRLKGSGQKGRSTEQKIVRGVMLAGQFIGTKDDNSVVNRSIPISVLRVDNRAEEQVMAHSKLKSLEKEGISSLICDMMSLRPIFRNEYGERFFVNQKRFQDVAIANGLSVQSRILRNIACMYTCMELAKRIFEIGIELPAFFDQCYNKMKELTMLVTRTSKISEFWRMLEYLLDGHHILYDQHFKIETVAKLKVVKGDDEEPTEETYMMPRKVLFLRFNVVYTIVEKETPPQNRHKLMNEESFMLYAKDQSWFLGKVKAKRFNSGKTLSDGRSGEFVTSCYAFDYDALRINLERGQMLPEDDSQLLIPATEVKRDVF